MKRQRISGIFADAQSFAGAELTVCGWARTIRDMKNFGFVELNDGSCHKSLQVVLERAALENYDEEGIDRYIAHADGVYEALTELKEQGVVIRNARARLSRTRLDDMFLFTELELTVEQEHITYLFTCQGTWRNGKMEWMQIYVPSVGYDGPAWLPQLSEAIATYDPG